MAHEIFILNTAGNLATKIGNTLAAAFAGAPDYSYILSGHPQKHAALAWFFGRFATSLVLRYGQLHATQDGAAALLVFAPGKSPSLTALLQAGVLSFPRQFGWKSTWRAWMLGLQMEKLRNALAPAPHWYVLAAGVAPEMQGRGIGYELITRIIRRAETDGLPCYLEAFEEHLVQHYQSRGFRILQQRLLPSGLHLWCLLRPPSTLRS